MAPPAEAGLRSAVGAQLAATAPSRSARRPESRASAQLRGRPRVVTLRLRRRGPARTQDPSPGRVRPARRRRWRRPAPRPALSALAAAPRPGRPAASAPPRAASRPRCRGDLHRLAAASHRAHPLDRVGDRRRRDHAGGPRGRGERGRRRRRSARRVDQRARGVVDDDQLAIGSGGARAPSRTDSERDRLRRRPPSSSRPAKARRSASSALRRRPGRRSRPATTASPAANAARRPGEQRPPGELDEGLRAAGSEPLPGAGGRDQRRLRCSGLRPGPWRRSAPRAGRRGTPRRRPRPCRART